MSSSQRGVAAILVLAAVVAAAFALYRARAPQPIALTILAINDFHGNLRAPAAGISIVDPKDRTKRTTVAAGGAEHLATLVKQLRTNKATSVFVAAGDLIGASPLLSCLFHDEPTI